MSLNITNEIKIKHVEQIDLSDVTFVGTQKQWYCYYYVLIFFC